MQLELLRSLFPSWNFYDRVGYQLVLEVKQTGSKDWQAIHFRASRTWGTFFVNPEVTRLHAEMTLLENFAQDIQRSQNAEGEVDSEAVRFLASFKMVRSLVMSRLMIGSESDFQFRVLAQAGAEHIVLFESEQVEVDL